MRSSGREHLVGFASIAGIAAALLWSCSIRDGGDSAPAPKTAAPRPSATASPSTEASPTPSGNAFKNPKFRTLVGIGSTIASRWHEAAPSDRTINTNTPLNASVIVKAAGKCSVRLTLSANGPANQDPGSFYLNPGAGGSVSASVECAGKRPIGLGASVDSKGILRTYWSQANTLVETTGNDIRTSDPVQPSFAPGAAEKAQDQTLAELDALTKIPVVPTGSKPPQLPQLPMPVVPIISRTA